MLLKTQLTNNKNLIGKFMENNRKEIMDMKVTLAKLKKQLAKARNGRR